MPLSTYVLVTDVNNLSDARYCAGMEVDMLGFNIQRGTPGFVVLETMKEIQEWLAGVYYLGEFKQPSDVRRIVQSCTEYEVGHALTTDFTQSSDLSVAGLNVVVQISLKDALDQLDALMDYAGDIKFLLLDKAGDDYSEDALIKGLETLDEAIPVLLGFGVNGENVAEIVENWPISGLALRGSDEISPGLKDYDNLADILEAIEVDDLD